MSSPYSTGGGGTQFETRVAAYYFAAALVESPARALPGLYATEALTQRADFGEPLDDLVILGLMNSGEQSKLSLQVKSSLTFTEKDKEWLSVLSQAWDSFIATGFDVKHHRLGVAISSYNARADKYYQSVLNWAVHSPSAEDFFKRISREDFSHKDQRAFVDCIKNILSDIVGQAVDNERLWQFLCVFRIIHFDFRNEETSRDSENITERIRHSLKHEERNLASRIWEHLIVRAGEAAPVAGGETRTTLLSSLVSANLPTLSNGTFWQDIQKIDRESQRGLSTIKSDIHGLRLKRNKSYDGVLNALTEGRFIQIDGEPGSGKSALLKQLALEQAQTGSVFFLKDSRILPRGWAAHAGQMGITDDLVGLLSEFACVGDPLLFIDGIDKISDPAVQLTVNDVIRAIASEPVLASWKILVTVREQNLDHIATWLDPEALKLLPIKSVTIPPLDEDDLRIISQEFPRLRPLLLEAENTDVILQRPFFLDSIISLAGRDGTEALPASEAELLKLWWELGGSDAPSFTSAQNRRNTLIELAERYLEEPTNPISIRDISSETIDNLKTAGVIRDANFGHTVVFTHDIFEEWALCEWLMNHLPNVAAALRSVGEPQELVRPLQLLGSYQLEFHDSDTEWRQLYAEGSQSDLRPVWQRALLTSCLRSTRSTEILNKLSDFLNANDHEVLKKLLNALQTLEVVPNPTFLDEKMLPGLEPDERVKLAHLAAWPKVFTWVRFLDWFLDGKDNPSPSLIPNLVPVFNTWQSSCAGQKIRHCKRIGEISGNWITEFEAARHPETFGDRRNPFGVSFRYEKEKELEDSIRSLFLSSAGDVPDLVTEYLKAKASARLNHLYRDKILAAGNVLGRHIPKQFVDYIIEEFLTHPKDNKRLLEHPGSGGRELGIEGHDSFYPASPLQPPFLVLLRQHEEEGLRLIRSICNHSIDVWRWLRQRSDYQQKGVTPVPVEIEFSWGSQSLWGDGQVYSWFRGGWGNHASQSALMALEYWSFERIEAGDDFGKVLQKAIEGNESVAALGLGVSLCIANLEKSMDHLLHFITCPQIWDWDLSRSTSDQSGNHSNEIADWTRFRHLMTAVRELNQRPHRRTYIRDLVPCFVFCRDDSLRDRYTAGIRSFPDKLPFQYEEEKKDKSRIAALRKSVDWYIEQADPQYWHTEPTEDGKQIKVWNDPPSGNAPERLEQLEHHEKLNRYLRLALWAQKCLEENTLLDDVSLEDALSDAKELDSEDIFKTVGMDFNAQQRTAAISGVAFVFARFAGDTNWDEATANWTIDTIRRAAAYVDDDEFGFRGSVLSMHPLIFAVYGNAALIQRDSDREQSQTELLTLALNPFDSVAGAVAESASLYAEQNPEFHWELFVLLLRRCIVEDSARPDYHSSDKKDGEKQHHKKLIDDALRTLAERNASTLPSIPLPWLEQNEEVAEDENSLGFVRNNLIFHTHIAEKTILKVDVGQLTTDDDQRRQFLILLEQLITATFQEMVPPFAENGRDHGGNTPYEWVFSFFHWLGTVCPHLSQIEIRHIILRPIFETDNESALMAMQSFARAFLGYVILPPAELNDDSFSTWESIANWIIENPEGRNLRYADREFSYCVFLTVFCFTRDFQPLICVVEEGWEPLKRFVPIIEKVVNKFGSHKQLYLGVIRFLQKGGLDLAPEPALEWLRGIAVTKKQDQEFWSSNGDETVDALKLILSKKADILTETHRESISFIIDILVDNGVRGAGFLQQDQLRK